MSNTYDYKKAIKNLMDFRSAADECVQQHLDLIRTILNEVTPIYQKGDIDNASVEDKGKLILFTALYEDIKKSHDAIDKFNDSLISDYSTAMELLVKIQGKSQNDIQ